VLYGNTTIITGIFLGIKPAVTAIVIAAGFRISKKILKKPIHITLALSAFLAMQLQVSYPIIIISAGLLGYLVFRYKPLWLESPDLTHTTQKQSPGSKSLIDDDSEQARHTQYSSRRFLIILGCSLLAFGLPFGVLLACLGSDHLLSQLAWFFTKVALLSFGGAYAVLPYVFQASVEEFGWLTTTQMMDGLALGETTPGPLIIVLTFVGFIAAYVNTLVLDSPILTGVLGAIVASWFVFLPSFCFIFLGGPLIESTRSELKLTPILTGITCAIVGVIANLAVFFALHTLFPENMNTGILIPHVIFSLAIIIIASIAMIRYQQSILRVLFVCAALGLVGSFFNIQ
jgi:chromate transporter